MSHGGTDKAADCIGQHICQTECSGGYEVLMDFVTDAIGCGRQGTDHYEEYGGMGDPRRLKCTVKQKAQQGISTGM